MSFHPHLIQLSHSMAVQISLTRRAPPGQTTNSPVTTLYNRPRSRWIEEGKKGYRVYQWCSPNIIIVLLVSIPRFSSTGMSIGTFWSLFRHTLIQLLQCISSIWDFNLFPGRINCCVPSPVSPFKRVTTTHFKANPIKFR